MDALTHIFKTIQLSANPYICRAGDGPWSIQYQYRPQGIFHLVVKGECYLREGGSPELVHLRVGDGVAFPTGGAHWICNHPENQHLPAENVVNVSENEGLFLLKSGDVKANTNDSAFWNESTREGKGIQETILLSCTLSYDATINHPFLRNLPCFIQASTRAGDEMDRLKALTSLLVDESVGAHPGKQLMINHLTEILFVQMLRVHMHSTKQSSGYLAALSDPHIGVALNLIHTETDKKWTVESLCKASALGRTAFTKKFVDMVGLTPKAYLSNTRLMEARAKLQSSNESTLRIAEAAGYASEAAFSKAFKKHFNKTPGELRRSK